MVSPIKYAMLVHYYFSGSAGIRNLVTASAHEKWKICRDAVALATPILKSHGLSYVERNAPEMADSENVPLRPVFVGFRAMIDAYSCAGVTRFAHLLLIRFPMIKSIARRSRRLSGNESI